jgi:diacylglycerol kinase family enzyme
MKLLVLVNEGTVIGTNPKETTLRISGAFSNAGADALVYCLDAPSLIQQAKEALMTDMDAIIAAGGDGTLNAVVNAIATGHKALGVLPLGKHNHFAHNLNIPTDLDQAAAALAKGKVIDWPIAEVNGRVFMNYCAIGVHAGWVRERSMVAAAGDVARKLTGRQPVGHVSVRARGHTFAHHSPDVIISNNPHQMKAFGVNVAPTPERGLLNVYVARPKRRGLAGMIGLGSNGSIPNFEAMALPDLRIDTGQKLVDVAMDGEIVELRSPLHYHVRTKPLRLLVP